MSSSTTLLDQVSSSAAQREATINGLIGAGSTALLNGRRESACSMLVWAGYGGTDSVGGEPTQMPNWSLTLTASSTCYIRKLDSTGVVSFVLGSGSPLEPPTDWPAPTGGYTALYTAVTGPSTVLSWIDHRVPGVAIGLTAPTGTGFPHVTSGSQDAAAKTYAEVATLLGTNVKSRESIIVAASDETTALTTGVKCTFRMPYAFTVTGVRASLTTAQTSGSIFTVDIHESGTTILSTKITIDNAEKTSTTAAAAPVISDASIADDAEMTVEIDQVGDGTAKGLKCVLIGNRT